MVKKKSRQLLSGILLCLYLSVRLCIQNPALTVAKVKVKIKVCKTSLYHMDALFRNKSTNKFENRIKK